MHDARTITFSTGNEMGTSISQSVDVLPHPQRLATRQSRFVLDETSSPRGHTHRLQQHSPMRCKTSLVQFLMWGVARATTSLTSTRLKSTASTFQKRQYKWRASYCPTPTSQSHQLFDFRSLIIPVPLCSQCLHHIRSRNTHGCYNQAAHGSPSHLGPIISNRCGQNVTNLLTNVKNVEVNRPRKHNMQNAFNLNLTSLQAQPMIYSP